MRRELKDAIVKRIDEELYDAGVYENLDEIRNKYNKIISNVETVDQAIELAYIFVEDLEDENHSFEKLVTLYNMGMSSKIVQLFEQPYYLKDKEFDLFVKMIENDIPYFIILAIRHSNYKELLSKFVMSDISVEDILPGNKYGIYFDYREMFIKDGYKEIVEEKVLNSPESRNELSMFREIRKWKVEDGRLRTKEGYDHLLDFNDNHHLQSGVSPATINSFTEEDKEKFDYVFNFDLALENRGNYANLMRPWNLKGIKLLYQSKHHNCIKDVYNLMEKLAQKRLTKKEFDYLYKSLMKGIGYDLQWSLLPYLNGNVELLDKYHIGYINAFDTDSYSFYDDLENKIEELEEYCKSSEFDDNRRKKYILDKILKDLEVFKKSPTEIEKEQAKESSISAKAKPTKTVESKNTSTGSAKPMDNNRAEILKNLIKNNVDKSVLLSSGFSEEEINRLMKPVNELLLNLIKNGVSDEILISSGYSIDEINECKRHL